MKRLLTLLALAGLSAAAGACGDDSGDDGDDTPKNDAGTSDAKVARPPQINADSLGTACTTAAQCQGVGALECLTSIGEDQEVPGGYCTAACESDAECGPNGFCPAAALATLPGVGQLVSTLGAGLIPQNCVLKCTKTGDAGGGCTRSDQQCAAIIDAIPTTGQAAGLRGIAQGFPFATTPFCFPPIELPTGDAGVPDAGAAALVVTGLDAGL
jgi:hypothetical protein